MTEERPDRPCDASVSRAVLHSYLVTRHTGRAVRLGIERRLESRPPPLVTVLDFRDVAVLDFSCADEIAAKLAATALEGRRPERFFLLTGLEEHHLDPVEASLLRRGLAVAAQRARGEPVLLGHAAREERRCWELVWSRGEVAAEGIAGPMGLSPRRTEALLAALHGRRLLLGRSGRYLSLGRVVEGAEGSGRETPSR